ncbi:hypothetical protein J6590_031107 [Homalodisca vitripennis]|nr:hypothetical protein J6590_031107 [Homalodisca vitripennis]
MGIDLLTNPRDGNETEFRSSIVGESSGEKALLSDMINESSVDILLAVSHHHMKFWFQIITNKTSDGVLLTNPITLARNLSGIQIIHVVQRLIVFCVCPLSCRCRRLDRDGESSGS